MMNYIILYDGSFNNLLITIKYLFTNNIKPINIVKEDNFKGSLTEYPFKPEINENCAKVSAVGAGMTGVPGVASKIVQALTDKGIQILQSADSHTTIWVLIKEKDVKLAVNALHDAFALNKINEILV